MKINRFEDSEVWKEARGLVKEIYRITAQPPFANDYSLKDQLRRASSSIMLNIAEGFDSGSDKQFIQFLSYSRRSCSEVQSIIFIGLDNNYLNKDKFHELYEQTTNIRKQCVGLIKYLSRTSQQLPRIRNSRSQIPNPKFLIPDPRSAIL